MVNVAAVLSFFFFFFFCKFSCLVTKEFGSGYGGDGTVSVMWVV
jgi:hypothetical protein